MYSGAGNYDPEKITKDAEELRLQSIGTASRLRQRLLLSMNQNTLQELAIRLFAPDQLFEYAHISGGQDPFSGLEQVDPIRGPVFAMIRQRGLLPDPPDLIAGKKMRATSAGTVIPRPELPCELEVALRWAADAPEIPFKILNRAFFDWTTTIVVNTNSRETFMEKYRTSYEPGKTKTPRKLAAHTKNLITSILGTPHRVDFESHLLFFATNFRPFWKKHAAAYKQLAKKKSSTNKASGAGGPISRVKADWQRRTNDFVRFCDGRNIPDNGSDEWDKFFDEFSQTQPEQKRTRKIIAGFMKTLLVQAKPISNDEIVNIIGLLKVEKIRAVDPETIRSCLEKLKVVADSSSTKSGAHATRQSP